MDIIQPKLNEAEKWVADDLGATAFFLDYWTISRNTTRVPEALLRVTVFRAGSGMSMSYHLSVLCPPLFTPPPIGPLRWERESSAAYAVQKLLSRPA
jgi:hypothetical protein